MKIKYEKGVFTIEGDGKCYAYNINDNVIINVKTNRVVQKIGYNNDSMHNLGREMLAEYGYKENNIYSIFGHMLCHMSLPIIIRNYPTALQKWDMVLNLLHGQGKEISPNTSWFDIRDFSQEDIRILGKIVKNSDEQYINVRTELDRYKKQILAEELGIPYEFYLEHSWGIENYLCKTQYSKLAIWYFYNQKMYLIDNSTQTIYQYLYACITMGKTPIKSNNALREITETLYAYQLWLKQDQENRFAQVYNVYKDKLTFDYGNFEIVLPKETRDLIREGNEMHHCVGGYVDRVSKGETLIVFVRNKNNLDKPYITCQVGTNGVIGQYYLAYDRHISSEEDKVFKQAYAEHLAKVWCI